MNMLIYKCLFIFIMSRSDTRPIKYSNIFGVRTIKSPYCGHKIICFIIKGNICINNCQIKSFWLRLYYYLYNYFIVQWCLTLYVKGVWLCVLKLGLNVCQHIYLSVNETRLYWNQITMIYYEYKKRYILVIHK